MNALSHANRWLRHSLFSLVLLGLIQTHAADLAPGVRGVATRAPKGMKIDGDLSEFKDAFCTPVEYFGPNVLNRAVQFFYMWDDEAFYAAMRTLDTKPANFAPDDRLWEGDAVEWYFDARQNENFRSHDWDTAPNPGAVHCYWTGLKGTNVVGRFCLRPGFTNAITGAGVEVAARRTKHGMDVEFKLPWANFPGFKAKAGTVIALDAEACYSDGGPRIARAFVYGSPLSVQQPASLAKIQLIETLEPAHWAACGPVMMPTRCDVAWAQATAPMVTGYMAVPPNQADHIGKIMFQLLRLDGSKLGEYEGKMEVFQTDGNFVRAKAEWPNDFAAPGTYHLQGIVFDKQGKELTRVAPRMVSTGMTPGY